jgi:hypothetical protein
LAKDQTPKVGVTAVSTAMITPAMARAEGLNSAIS